MADDGLALRYAEHPPVRELIDLLTYCAEGVSRAFDGWDDPRAHGPGLYFVVVAGTSVGGYADPMGDNEWPAEECRLVRRHADALFETARTVAMESDGAVVVGVDGAIHRQMVRLKDLPADHPDAADGVDYADWMGARHMSALDASLREAVIAAVTLSEEDGRVTVFRDGTYDDTARERLGGPWRPET